MTLFKNLYAFWCIYYTFYTIFADNSLRTTVPKSSLDSTSISLAGARNESYFYIISVCADDSFWKKDEVSFYNNCTHG